MLETSMGKIGEFFKDYRTKHGYSMRALADMLSVQHSYIGMTETGTLQLPQELCRKLYPLLDNSEKAKLIQAIKADHALQLKSILDSLKADERRF
jgi:transcriptional regulator with XRE-family HTH domain